MRPIDGDSLYEEINKWPESVMYKDWVQSAIANAPTIALPPNAPLTPDELWEMGRDWVWIASLIPNYVVVTGYYIKYPDFSYSDGILIGYPGHMSRYLKYAQYGRAWLAYRWKPEEVTSGS